MKKRNVCRAVAAAAALCVLMTAAGCKRGPDVSSEAEIINAGWPEANTASEIVTSEEESEESGRADGERFDQLIMVEGEEATVGFEHVKNAAIGYEMDFDYEILKRRKGDGVDRLISVYDDEENPVNYLEVTFAEGTEEAVGTQITEELLQEHRIVVSSGELDNGEVITVIDATGAKEDGVMSDKPEIVYIISANGGCIVATAHFSRDAVEGFGSRFATVVRTINVI